MITFQDLICQKGFRQFAEQRLRIELGKEAYRFPDKLPTLYKYRAISDYSVKDILSNQLTMSAIGSFNDLFDGAIHEYGTREEQIKAAEAEWEKLNKSFAAINMRNMLDRDQYVSMFSDHHRTESRLRFRLLDYLGAYVCCFSEKNNSMLMWSHYADSSKGICIGYDFNILPQNNLLRNMLFPVAYSRKPVYLTDLLKDEDRKIYEFSLDAAVLCAALNKADIWNYESEWRMLFLSLSSNNSVLYQPINSLVRPSSINLGYHFLKPMFYCDYKNQEERNRASKAIENVFQLILYAQEKKIPLYIMIPQVGQYDLKPVSIDTATLINFMRYRFDDNNPEDMRYYYTIHDELMDILEEEKLNV